MRGQYPLMERNLGTLKYRPDGHAELLAAVATEQQADAMRLPVQAAIALRAAAMRADRAVRPADGFKMIAGGVVVGKAGFGKHGRLPLVRPVCHPILHLSSI